MYDVVKSDPSYIRKGYKASAHMIQDMMDMREREGKAMEEDEY